ncbi:MAG: hypothetical protein RLZZ393_326 [Pseudomonadota bacterium]
MKQVVTAARWRFVVLAVVMALALASNAWRDLVQPDEGRYAEIPREMLADGDWVVPHLNGLPYIEKPPLQYWATAVAYRLFGVEGWVSRLWNLLLGIGGLVLVHATGRKLWGSRAGDAAALVLLATPLYMMVGQLNLLDMGLTFFLTAALCGFLLGQREGVETGESRRWMLVCWVAIGLGFLQKGLVAGAVPVLALVAYSLVQRDAGIWRRLRLGTGLLVLALLCLPWLLALGLRDGRYAWFFLIHEHFTRFLTTEHHRQEPWWYFIAVLGVGCLPWTFLMLRGAWRSVAARATGRFDPAVALSVWAAVVVLFFSLSGSKLAPYIMPVTPPLALLAGRELARGPSVRAIAALLGLAGLLAALLLGSHALVLQLAPDGLKRAFYLAVSQWAMAGGACAAAGLCGAILFWRRRSFHVAVAALAMGLYLCWMVVLGGANLMSVLRGAPGAQSLVAPRVAAGAPFYCVGNYLQSLTFEVGAVCRLVEYRGELQFQFEDSAAREPLSLGAFAREWSLGGRGVALVGRPYLAPLAALGVPTRILAEYPEFVILEHP